MGGGASSWRRAAQRIGFPCSSLSGEAPPHQTPATIFNSEVSKSLDIAERIQGGEHCHQAAKQNLCTICLELLGFNDGGGSSLPAIFTAQCSHSFHLACIASNVRHGNVACPICRTNWPHLPRELVIATRRVSHSSIADPILRILDDSIATSRVNRRSSLRYTRYDDDDPTEPNVASLTPHYPPRLRFSLPRPFVGPSACASSRLYVRLAPQLPIDLVLVATPNGSHLRLLKQAIALAVFSLHPTDRLALITCSPAAATRAFALHRMSSHGKRAALQVIDRLFYLGEADPAEGLRKAVRILEDRTHRNPLSCILHLSDSPIARVSEQQLPVQVHWFHVGFGFGASGGFVMHEFEEFLARVLGGEVREVQLRFGEEGVMIEDLRCGEERRIPVDLTEASEFVYIQYSYKECLGEERMVIGDAVVAVGEKGDRSSDEDVDRRREVGRRRRRSCAERWDYLDPFMARRWAKHLHGYRA